MNMKLPGTRTVLVLVNFANAFATEIFDVLR